jgi:hypothetical protein
MAQFWLTAANKAMNSLQFDKGEEYFNKADALLTEIESESETGTGTQTDVNTPNATPTPTDPNEPNVNSKIIQPWNPYAKDYPDAFEENGVWKVVRDGKKYRIQE